MVFGFLVRDTPCTEHCISFFEMCSLILQLCDQKSSKTKQVSEQEGCCCCQVHKRPFDRALSMMNLPEQSDLDEPELITPAAKRPKCMEVVAGALETTPPPVVGPQTVASPYKCPRLVCLPCFH